MSVPLSAVGELTMEFLKSSRFKIWRLAPLIAAAGFLCAQSGGIHRTILQKQDLSIPGHEVVVARVQVDPGAYAGRHTHPGEEISYIL
ncbi:MAG TPA: hypothetical protein VG345_06425, partial [Bryobacteraceae bacterium]|nr:hypothetical protein [Bryobacteraceae bacterium]